MKKLTIDLPEIDGHEIEAANRVLGSDTESDSAKLVAAALLRVAKQIEDVTKQPVRR